MRKLLPSPATSTFISPRPGIRNINKCKPSRSLRSIVDFINSPITSICCCVPLSFIGKNVASTNILQSCVKKYAAAAFASFHTVWYSDLKS